jgi:MFS family permease
LNKLSLPWLILLGALTAIGPLSIDMYLPAFPAMEQDLRAMPGSMEYTLSSFFIGMALGQLFYGPLSDKFGRRRPLMAGLALYTLASLGCAYAGNVPALVGLRFIEALGGCAGMVITRAVVRDRCGARLFPADPGHGAGADPGASAGRRGGDLAGLARNFPAAGAVRRHRPGGRVFRPAGNP